MVLAALLATAPTLASGRDSAVVDAATGLAVGEHVGVIQANCTGCHSTRLITQARLSRGDWESTIRWMQRTQGLWPFPAATEDQILDYLTRNYGPGERMPRRKPLPRSLLPPSREMLSQRD